MASEPDESDDELLEVKDLSISDRNDELDILDKFGPDRLRKGETVLQLRTSRILLVLEQCHDSFNHQV